MGLTGSNSSINIIRCFVANVAREKMLFAPWKDGASHAALPENVLSSQVPGEIPGYPPGKALLCS